MFGGGKKSQSRRSWWRCVELLGSETYPKSWQPDILQVLVVDSPRMFITDNRTSGQVQPNGV